MAIQFVVMGAMMAGATVMEGLNKTRALREEARDVRSAYKTEKKQGKRKLIQHQKFQIASSGARGVEMDIEGMVNSSINWLEAERIRWDNAVRAMEGLETGAKNVMNATVIKATTQFAGGFMKQGSFNMLTKLSQSNKGFATSQNYGTRKPVGAFANTYTNPKKDKFGTSSGGFTDLSKTSYFNGGN